MSNEVEINFKYIDDDSDTLTVTQFWSTGGPFLPITMLTGDVDHTLPIGGIVNATPTGVDYTTVWDARTDTGSGFSGNATIRTTLDDGTAPPVNIDQIKALDNNDAPSGSIDTVVQRPADQFTTDIGITVYDSDSDPITVTTEFSTVGFGGPFLPITMLTGDGAHTFTTPVPATPGGVSQNIVWDSGTDLPVGFVGNVYFKFSLDDGIETPVDVQTSESINNNEPPVVTAVTLTLRP